MPANTLELKTINELNEYLFYIPSYQRGYRWTKKEVIELLDDINDFFPKPIENTKENTWYCLQPIVIKKIEENKYEVIDGQQRLTTIFLILFYLDQDYIDERKKNLFKLEYETRSKTQDFLINLASNTKEQSDFDNIDFYYINEAYRYISDWFSEKQKLLDFYKDAFRLKIKRDAKVIWYESFEEDPISIFIRINIGKIPLTNSELIKALFLNKSNFPNDSDSDSDIEKKQREISIKWDNIEQRLQDDRFWYFLTKDTNKKTNRIEIIFDLMNDKDKGEYSTFRYFSEKFTSNNIDTIKENWDKIEDYFQILSGWYDERDLYHKIGYLVSSKPTMIKELINTTSFMTKTRFKDHLDDLIKNSIKDVKLEDLRYGSDNDKIKKVLLLYNILTMLTSDKDNSCFPFDLYKKEKWDIEHIISIKNKMPDPKDKKQWLDDAKPYIDATTDNGESLIKRIKGYNENPTDDIFKELFDDVSDHFNSDLSGSDDINEIYNLALLDAVTNRGYKNAVFPVKRKTIIERDKAGVFIPICTKNVFLKYFSEYPPAISFWTDDDKKKYEEDLNKILSPFLSEDKS